MTTDLSDIYTKTFITMLVHSVQTVYYSFFYWNNITVGLDAFQTYESNAVRLNLFLKMFIFTADFTLSGNELYILTPLILIHLCLSDVLTYVILKWPALLSVGLTTSEFKLNFICSVGGNVLNFALCTINATLSRTRSTNFRILYLVKRSFVWSNLFGYYSNYSFLSNDNFLKITLTSVSPNFCTVWDVRQK